MKKQFAALLFLAIGIFSLSSPVLAARPKDAAEIQLEETRKEEEERKKILADQALSSPVTIPWEKVALGVSMTSGVAAIMGFSFRDKKKRRAISKYMNEIDDTYHEYKIKGQRCEAELYRLRDLLETELKGGKIDESVYHLLVNRIEKYLKDMTPVDEVQTVSVSKPRTVEEEV